MKYIRTENGIEKLDADREYLAEYMNGKQADTIEKLVDEYVRVHKTFINRSRICDKELAISSSKYPKHYDVYGSIWVDGNLIKVAKMNKEGELELL